MKLKLLIASLLLATTAFAYQPGPYDMVIQAGEDYVLTYFEASKAGIIIDQTGTTYVAQCGSAPGVAPFANFSSYVVSPAAGTVTAKLSKAQTTKNAGKTGVWWIKRTDAAGLVSYRLAGKCAVVPR